MTTRHEFIENLKKKLDETNNEIDKMEAKAKAAQIRNREKYDFEIRRVRQKRDEILQKLEKIKQSTDESWTELREGADLAWKSLKEAFKRARDHLE